MNVLKTLGLGVVFIYVRVAEKLSLLPFHLKQVTKSVFATLLLTILILLLIPTLVLLVGILGLRELSAKLTASKPFAMNATPRNQTKKKQ